MGSSHSCVEPVTSSLRRLQDLHAELTILVQRRDHILEEIAGQRAAGLRRSPTLARVQQDLSDIKHRINDISAEVERLRKYLEELQSRLCYEDRSTVILVTTATIWVGVLMVKFMNLIPK